MLESATPDYGTIRLGFCAYVCKSCRSIVLVGVVPAGWSSSAIPRCPATDQNHNICAGTMDQLDTKSVGNVLKSLTYSEVQDGGL